MARAAATLSRLADQRLRKPRTRGAFMPIDAARRQLGLLSVGDGLGQSRIYWLINLDTSTIEDARFLSFGEVTSHPIADIFTESVRGLTVHEACRLPAERLESQLRDDPTTPAFGAAGMEPLAFVPQIQERAERELPNLTLLPKPADVLEYQRKRKQDWTAEDQAWLPLGLLQKIAAVDRIAGTALHERLGRDDVGWIIEGLHDDFRVVMRFTNLEAEQVPTVAKFLEDALNAQAHSQIAVEALIADPTKKPNQP